MTFLLAITYLAFISLGLPDAMLGSAWPSMHGQLHVPVSYAGMVSMIISIGTVVSSLLSDRLTRKCDSGERRLNGSGFAGLFCSALFLGAVPFGNSLRPGRRGGGCRIK